MTRKHSVAVVGAGSAGLACAIALARDGHCVHVFEKHSAPTTRGAGLLIQPQGVAAIESLGLTTRFQEIGVPIRRLQGMSHRNWKLVDIPYGATMARAVTRAALSQVLYEEAVAAGVTPRFDCKVDGFEVLD